MRIDKFLSNLKFGTRKEVKEQIKNGIVSVNGILVKDGSENINPETDLVYFDQEEIYYKNPITLMMNKPAGVVSANTDAFDQTVMDLLPEKYQRFDFNIAGRLDKDTEGMLILTTDGALLHKIISPNKEVYKSYYVKLDSPITSLKKLEEGVTINDGKDQPYLTKPAYSEIIDETTCILRISEGKFHQVKRMFESVGLNVVYLKRTAIGSLKLDSSLGLGEVTELSEKDILKIFERI